MQVSAKLFPCTLLLLLASLVSITFAKINPDKQLIQFMSSFNDVKQVVDNVEEYETHFTQQITHYNRLNIETWRQRHYLNDQFYAGGPAWLLLGGLHEVSPEYFRHPVWTEIAQRTRGVLLAVEHRCFGLSRPSVPEHEFLHSCNTEEALADIVYAVTLFKTSYPKSTFIVIGEGHGGKLAAWSRLKFPHHINGAVVINSPLKPRLDFYEFFNDVKLKLLLYNGVMDTIHYAYEIIDDDIQNNRLGQLQDKLKLCENPDDPEPDIKKKNIQFMIWSISWNLGLITVLKNTNKEKYKKNVISLLGNHSERNPVEVLSEALDVILRRYKLLCIPVNYKQVVYELQNTSKYAEKRLHPTLKSAFVSREYFWQSCTEFGYLKTSTKENFFGDIPLDFYIGLCMDVFGPSFDEDLLVSSIETTNIFYNWEHIKTDQILFINYDGHREEKFALTEYYYDNHDIKIVKVPEIPDTPVLTNDVRDALKKSYDEIYDYIQVLTGVQDLEPPKIVAHRVHDEDDEQTEKQLIQFMISFRNVKYIAETKNVRYYTFNQYCNHLDRTTMARWNQRYYLNDEFYKVDGPALLLIGGLTELTEDIVKNPVWTEIIQRTNGILFALEHRCFGNSLPPGDTLREYLQHCNSEQALYDIARFVKYNREIYYGSKWILIGESHGGKLATWFRLKFPSLVEGAVAINAPLMPQKEFREFYDYVNRKLTDFRAIQTIKAAYTIIEKNIEQNKFDYLIEKLNLCSNPATSDPDVQKKNIQYMIWSITWHLGVIYTLKNTKRKSYRTMLRDILEYNEHADHVQKLSDALQMVLTRYNSLCIHVNYQEAVNYLKSQDQDLDIQFETLTIALGNRESFWMNCTEFGYMKTSTKENMFGDVPLDFFIGLCKDVFGSWYDDRLLDKSIQTTRTFYNGKDIDASEILFINYTGYIERIFTLTENNAHQHFEIINYRGVPDVNEMFPPWLRSFSIEQYKDIYKYIEEVTGVAYLIPANVKAKKVIDDDDEDQLQTDERLLQFMLSFKGVRQVVDAATVRSFTFNQSYNHLDRRNMDHWSQTYYMNDQFYEDDGPSILVAGELNELMDTYVKHPVWTEMVQRFKGKLFALEPRCYGHSHPPVPADKYLQLCNSEQQLYDISQFIKTQNDINGESKWIIIGESHGGKLAAWFRLKFPSLVYIAVAINAPLEPQKEFSEFFVNVNEQLSKTPGVMETIQDAYIKVAEDIEKNRLEQLKDKLKLCSNPANSDAKVQEKNINYMLWSITWNLGTIPRLDEKYKKNVLETLVDKSEIDPVQKLSKALHMLLSRYKTDCIHVNYQEAVEILKTSEPSLDKKFVTLTKGLGNREAFWQSCTEFGYMKTSTKENMFGDVKLDFFIGLCKNVIGPWYTNDLLDNSIKTSNMFYKGMKIKATSIIFINYEGYIENIFAVTDYNDNYDLLIIRIPDMPDDPVKLSYRLGTKLRQKYYNIYQMIKLRAELKTLEPPNVVARRIPDVDDDASKKTKDEVGSSVGPSGSSGGND